MPDERFGQRVVAVVAVEPVVALVAVQLIRAGRAAHAVVTGPADDLVLPGLADVLELLTNDVVAELDALVADKDRRSRDQLADFVLGLAAKRTVEELSVLVLSPAYKSAVGFVAIVLVLTFRPRGLLGERAY